MGFFYPQIEAAESWEDSIDDIIATFEKQQRRKLLYSISFYWDCHEYTSRILLWSNHLTTNSIPAVNVCH